MEHELPLESMATFKGLHLRFQSVVDRNVLMCCLHRFLNPHRLLVETWCFTPSSKVNLLFVSPFVQLKSLILLLVLCPKRRDSQLTNRSQGGRLIISCDKVRFFEGRKMLEIGPCDSKQTQNADQI